MVFNTGEVRRLQQQVHQLKKEARAVSERLEVTRREHANHLRNFNEAGIIHRIDSFSNAQRRHLNSEQFLDDIVKRLKDKQL